MTDNTADFCYKCGRQLASNDRFCQQCGAEVGAVESESQFYGTDEEENTPNFIPPSVIDEAETVVARRSQTLPTNPPPVKETVIISPAPAPVVIEKSSQTNKVLAIALGIVTFFALGLGFLLYLNLSRQNTAATNNVNVKIATPTRTPVVSNANTNANLPVNANVNSSPISNENSNVSLPDTLNQPTPAPTPPDVLAEPTISPTPEITAFRFGTRDFEGAIGGNYSVNVSLTREGSVLSGEISPKDGSKHVSVEGYIEENGEFVLRELDSTRTITGIYQGTLDNQNNMSGFWKKPDGSAKRRFTFTATR